MQKLKIENKCKKLQAKKITHAHQKKHSDDPIYIYTHTDKITKAHHTAHTHSDDIYKQTNNTRATSYNKKVN